MFHVTAIARRKDAVYPATIVDIAPMDNLYMGGASVKLLPRILKMSFAEIVDIALPTTRAKPSSASAPTRAGAKP